MSASNSSTLDEKTIQKIAKSTASALASGAVDYVKKLVLGKGDSEKLKDLREIISRITDAEFKAVKGKSYYERAISCFSLNGDKKWEFNENLILQKEPDGRVGDVLHLAVANLSGKIDEIEKTSKLNIRKIISYWFSVMCNFELKDHGNDDRVIMLQWLDRILQEISDFSSISMVDIVRDSYWFFSSPPPAYFGVAVSDARRQLVVAISLAELEKNKTTIAQRFNSIEDVNTTLLNRHIPEFFLNVFSGPQVKGMPVSQLNESSLLGTLLAAVVFQVFDLSYLVSSVDLDQLKLSKNIDKLNQIIKRLGGTLVLGAPQSVSSEKDKVCDLEKFIKRVEVVLKNMDEEGNVNLGGPLKKDQWIISSGFSKELLDEKHKGRIIDQFIKLLHSCDVFQRTRYALLAFHGFSFDFGNFVCYVANEAMRDGIEFNKDVFEIIQREMEEIYKLIDGIRLETNSLQVSTIPIPRVGNLRKARKIIMEDVHEKIASLQLQMQGVDKVLDIWRHIKPEDVQGKLEAHIKAIFGHLTDLQSMPKRIGSNFVFKANFETVKRIQLLVHVNSKQAKVIQRKKLVFDYNAQPVHKFIFNPEEDMKSCRENVIQYLDGIINQNPRNDLQLLIASLDVCRRAQSDLDLKRTAQEESALEIYYNYFVPLRGASEKILLAEKKMDPDNQIFTNYITAIIRSMNSRVLSRLSLYHAEYIVSACGSASQIEKFSQWWKQSRDGKSSDLQSEAKTSVTAITIFSAANRENALSPAPVATPASFHAFMASLG